VRSLLAVLAAAAVVVAAGCSPESGPELVYGAPVASVGESLSVLGFNMSVSNLRWDGDYVLVDVDAAPATEGGAHAAPTDVRFGLYGALAHPIEADAVGGCDDVADLSVRPAVADGPDRLTGTVCLGPLRDRAQVRGVYVYSPRDRIPGTAAAYGAAYPVGVLPTNPNDTGLSLHTTSVEAFRADGSVLTPAALHDAEAFTGDGYMLLGLQIDGPARQYADESAARGGPMMVLAAPTRPRPGLSYACDVYGSSVLVLPDAALDAVQVKASLCTQGEINEAVLYATVSLVGTHAGLWRVPRDRN